MSFSSAAEAQKHNVGRHSVNLTHAAFMTPWSLMNGLCYVYRTLLLISINGVLKLSLPPAWCRVSSCRSGLKTVLQVLVKGISYPLRSPRRHIGRRCLLC